MRTGARIIGSDWRIRALLRSDTNLNSFCGQLRANRTIQAALRAFLRTHETRRRAVALSATQRRGGRGAARVTLPRVQDVGEEGS